MKLSPTVAEDMKVDKTWSNNGWTVETCWNETCWTSLKVECLSLRLFENEMKLLAHRMLLFLRLDRFSRHAALGSSAIREAKPPTFVYPSEAVLFLCSQSSLKPHAKLWQLKKLRLRAGCQAAGGSLEALRPQTYVNFPCGFQRIAAKGDAWQQSLRGRMLGDGLIRSQATALLPNDAQCLDLKRSYLQGNMEQT